MKVSKFKFEKTEKGWKISGELNGETIKIAEIRRAPNMSTDIFNIAIVSLMCKISDGWENGFIV